MNLLYVYPGLTQIVNVDERESTLKEELVSENRDLKGDLEETEVKQLLTFNVAVFNSKILHGKK